MLASEVALGSWMLLTLSGAVLWIRYAQTLAPDQEQLSCARAFELCYAGCWTLLVVAFPDGPVSANLLSFQTAALYFSLLLSAKVFFTSGTSVVLRSCSLSILGIQSLLVYLLPHRSFVDTVLRLMKLPDAFSVQKFICVVSFLLLAWLVGRQEKRLWHSFQFSLRTLLYLQVLCCSAIGVVFSHPLRYTFVTVVFSLLIAAGLIAAFVVVTYMFWNRFHAGKFLLVAVAVTANSRGQPAAFFIVSATFCVFVLWLSRRK